MQHVYKIMTSAEWVRLEFDGRFEGSAVDLRDGFIHLSYAGQVAETARRHFGGSGDLVLLAIPVSTLGPALKTEPSRGGALFPHLYAPLRHDDVLRTWLLTRDAAGVPVIPDNLED